MRILAVDYGKKKIGLAIADGPLAEPLQVIRYQDTRTLGEKIKKIVDENKIEKVIVGISEGEMAEEIKKFVSAIRSTLYATTIETFDETLSTQDAQKLAIEAGIKRKKRKSLEDAFAATLMLQSYLDSHV